MTDSTTPADAPRALTGFNELAVTIMRTRFTTANMTAAAGDLISDHARYNMWAQGQKGRVTTRELWNISALSEHLLGKAQAAWNALLGSTRTKEDCQAFVNAIGSLTAAMRTTYHTGVMAFEDPEMPEDILDLP